MNQEKRRGEANKLESEGEANKLDSFAPGYEGFFMGHGNADEPTGSRLISSKKEREIPAPDQFEKYTLYSYS